MRLKMLRDDRGSPNGIAVEDYKAGEEYEIPYSLARVFIHLGSAIEITVAESEEKAIASAPENASAPVKEIEKKVKKRR